MANKVFNMEGGLHSAAAYAAFENAMYGSCVASADDYVATAGTGMNVSLSTGNGLISTGTGFARRIASDSVNTIAITAAASSARIDSIVAYIDNGATPTTSVVDNTNNILKFIAVAGTPAATPSAPTTATIQSAVGAGNPYMILWNITIPANATALTNATFTDVRTIANIVDGVNIEDGSIGADKVDWDSLSGDDLDAVTSTSRLDIGKWHFYYVAFTNSASGWAERTLTIPSDFGGNIKDIHLSATFGNSANNYGCTWWGQAAGSTSVKVRFYQASSGNNGWFAVILAIF